jgi:hypothetical protein
MTAASDSQQWKQHSLIRSIEEGMKIEESD